jgi:16S rRNA (cytosine967-C5)-methyltransferase
VFEQGAYADRALHAEAGGLNPRDRALATAIAFGAVQRRATLDHLIGILSGRDARQLDPHVVAALRIGLVQILYLDGVADHAAVSEAVELAKRGRGGGFKLVNAVLRRATREGRELLAAFGDETAAQAALKHSVPEWLAELWWRELGGDDARALVAHVNDPGESALRCNLLVARADDLLRRLPDTARPRPAAPADPETPLPEGIVLGGPFDAHGSELWHRGELMPQSRGSMTVARLLAPAAGSRVLDLCAAPGGKTTHLAALTGPSGVVVAVERHPGRAAALRRTCRRMRCEGWVRVETGDAAGFDAGGEPFDHVLVDPPCSGLGTLQSRPDLRWRADPARIGELAELQGRLLAAGAGAVRPGGTLVYSVCTLTHAEGEGVIEGFLEGPGGAGFAVQRRITLLPHRTGTDGFFIAGLRREG